MLRIVLCFLLLLPALHHATAQDALKSDPNAVFPVEELTIVSGAGEFRFSVEIADEQHERSRGLMHREEKDRYVARRIWQLCAVVVGHSRWLSHAASDKAQTARGD